MLQFSRRHGGALAALAALMLAATFAHARADSFGAIAVSPSTHAYGWSADTDSREAAEIDAIKMCGKKDCVVKSYYWNGCGAIAFGDNRSWGTDWGADKDAATVKAIKSCSRFGKNCRLERWTCSTGTTVGEAGSSESQPIESKPVESNSGDQNSCVATISAQCTTQCGQDVRCHTTCMGLNAGRC